MTSNTTLTPNPLTFTCSVLGADPGPGDRAGIMATTNWVGGEIDPVIHTVNSTAKTINSIQVSTPILNLTPRIFSTLPAANSSEGVLVYVTDSTVNVVGGTILGNGTFHVVGFSNGTLWKVLGA